MEDQELEKALEACPSYAEQGYDFANERYQAIHKVMRKARRQLKETDAKQEQVERLENSLVIARERENVEELQRMDAEIQSDLEVLLDQQKEFSIVVYGRTMAGKSTLMEILTHGTGASIGKGAQRTTRDVREYHWKGMKVIDVPGICSFDGREDDELAMRAAKSADLVLFLITDDAPQDSEAEKLAELKRHGKNVLGLINVKVGLNLTNPVRRKMALRDLQKRMAETARIDEICDQFRAYGPRYHQDWSNLTFVATHLDAAYRGSDDPELYALSNFDAVQEYILDKVQNDACFLRMKTFIDRISVPLSDHIASILDDEAKTVNAALAYRHKWHELDDWQEEFAKETSELYNRFIGRLRTKVNGAIFDFAEDNYENEKAGEAWNHVVANMHLEHECRTFLEERAAVCDHKRRELADDFATEIQFSSGIDAKAGGVQMEGITDFSSFFGGAAAVTALIPGIGWGVSIGLGILSLFSDSKEKKIREAKAALRDKLDEVMTPVIDKIGQQIRDAIDAEIMQKGIGGFGRSLVDMDEMLFELAAAQNKLVEKLNTELMIANEELWTSAMEIAMPGTSFDTGKTMETNRIPGRVFVMFAPQSLPRKTIRRMEDLLGENIRLFKYDPEDEEDMPEQVNDLIDDLLGEDWGVGTLDYGGEEDLKLVYAVLPDKDIDTDSVEYRLAQQMIGNPMLRP